MIFSTLRVLFEHGKQYISHTERAELPPPFRGRPVLRAKGLEPSALQRVAEMCPTRAIGVAPFTLDMGRCLFCGECERMLPDNIRFSTSWHLWAMEREALVVKADEQEIQDSASESVTQKYRMFRHAIHLRQVCAGGDGANEMELNAAGNVNFDMRRYGIEFVASPRHADAIVVTGPVTRKMAEPLEMAFAAVPQPRILIAVGADAISGGLFEGSEQIDRSFFGRHMPDLYVAGHPAHPLAFIGGVRCLLGR